MRSHASFSDLFRQSRYCRSAEEDAKLTYQNRRELYSVAAVAFAAKHDQNFGRHLLLHVVGVSPGELSSARIVPQAAHCSDLMICTQRRLYIVEFKIDARLSPHQQPGNAHFLGSRGYGRQLAYRAKQKGLLPGTYTVIKEDASFHDSEIRNIRVRARNWKDLVPKQSSAFIDDLFDSLARFSIRSLELRNIDPMKKHANNVSSTIEMYTMLSSALQRYPTSALDIGKSENHEWCGMPLQLRRGQREKTAAVLGHTWRHFGWAGYIVPIGGGDTELTVWLYFKTDDLRRRSETKLKGKIPGASIRRSDDGGVDLYVARASRAESNECKWFESTVAGVLQAVGIA